MSEMPIVNKDFYNYIDMTDKVRPAIRNHEPNTTIYLTITEKKKNIEKDPDHTYRLNNVGHRSDDFNVLNKENLNILFAGCSTTFGEGVKEKHRWTNRVYEELKKDNPNIGPLNVLAYPGFGIDVITHNIFKYIDNYGIPDVIFLLIPDYFRLIQYSPEDLVIHPNIVIDYRTGTLKGDYFTEELFFIYQRYVRILDIMCRVNNIKLYIGTWDSKTDAELKQLGVDSFKTILFDFNKLLDSSHYQKIAESTAKEDKPYLYDSRDGDHPGILIHEYFAQRFLERYRYDTANRK